MAQAIDLVLYSCIILLHILLVHHYSADAPELPLLKGTLRRQIIASPAQRVLPLPRLLCGEVTFPENTYGRQIRVLVVVPVFTL